MQLTVLAAPHRLRTVEHAFYRAESHLGVRRRTRDAGQRDFAPPWGAESSEAS